MSFLDRLRGFFASFLQRQWEDLDLDLDLDLDILLGRLRGRREAITLYVGLNDDCRDFLLERLDRRGWLEGLPGLMSEQHQRVRHPGEFIHREIKFKAIDLGGPQIARRVRRDYCKKVDAVVYIVDAAFREHLAESRNELDALLSDEALANVPFLVLGDTKFFLNEPWEGELLCQLRLTNFTTGKGRVNLEPTVRPLEVFMCDFFFRIGYEDGFKWLSQYIKRHIYHSFILVVSERRMHEFFLHSLCSLCTPVDLFLVNTEHMDTNHLVFF